MEVTEKKRGHMPPFFCYSLFYGGMRGVFAFCTRKFCVELFTKAKGYGIMIMYEMAARGE